MLIIEIGLWNKEYKSWYDYSFVKIAIRSVLKALKEHNPPISIKELLVGLEKSTEAKIKIGKNDQVKVQTVWEIKLPFTVRKVPISHLHLQAIN